MEKQIHSASHKALYFLIPIFKRTLLLAGLVCACSFVRAQSLDLGIRGSGGFAYLLNSDFFASGTEQAYRITVSDNYGLQGAVNFKHGYAVEFGLLMGTLRQGYSGTFSEAGYLPGVNITYQDGESYTSSIKISTLEIPLLYRYTNKRGNYFELGMEYEIFSSATYSATYRNPAMNYAAVTTLAYDPRDFNLIAGLGKDKRLGGSRFYLNYGLRLTYGLLDMEGVDGHGQTLIGPGSISLYDPNTGPAYYATYHQTHPFYLSLNAGLFYRFGFANIHNREIEF